MENLNEFLREPIASFAKDMENTMRVNDAIKGEDGFRSLDLGELAKRAKDRMDTMIELLRNGEAAWVDGIVHTANYLMMIHDWTIRHPFIENAEPQIVKAKAVTVQPGVHGKPTTITEKPIDENKKD